MKFWKVAATVAILAASALADASLYKTCSGCHGASGKQIPPGGKSRHVLYGKTESEIYDAMVGYKNGTYGGPLAPVMQGQTARLRIDQIKNLSAYIVENITKTL